MSAKRKNRKKTLRITEADFMLANRRAARLEEIAEHGRPVTFRKALHRSKKVYDRKRLKHRDICCRLAAMALVTSMTFSACTMDVTESVTEPVSSAEAVSQETGPGEYYLDTLAVVPEYRHRGIGRALLEDGIRLGKSKGFDLITLVVDSDMPDLVRL